MAKNKIDLTAVGKNIRYYRKQNNISQDRLAELSELSSNYIGQIELGNKQPSLESLIRIANALHVSSDLLLSDLIEKSHSGTTSILYDKISHLPMDKQKFIYVILDTMVHEIENDIN